MLPLTKSTEIMYDYTADEVKNIIISDDTDRMREVSQYFFKVSGIYKRLIYFFACLPNFDTLIIPHLLSEKPSKSKLLKDFNEAMEFVDNLNVKMIMPLITVSIFKDGAYYGYLRDDKDPAVVQTLPIEYCRSQFKKDGLYTVEFNLEYFDREYRMVEDRIIALKQFPKEISKAYHKHKSGATSGLGGEWVLLNLENAFCFRLSDETPFFIPIIIDLIELRQAKEIEIDKDRLELFQLLVQKLPINKEGDLVFDLTEARELHKNAVGMLQNNEGIDVLTTFAEMDMLNITEARQIHKDNLLKNERSVFNEAGVSKMVFATEGNVSLKFSLQKDEALFRMLWPQFSAWLTKVVNLQRKQTKYYFEVFIPPVTLFNEQEMEQRYLKQATFGYGKLLPGIITGIKQSTLINLMKFENDYLELNDLMEPLKSSHTQSGDKDKEGGRPSKPEEEKEEETIDNEETGSQGGEE